MERNIPADTLAVRTFGTFVLHWNGKTVISGGKSGDSQSARLLQAVLHHPEDGMSRDDLEEQLFGDRDIGNLHHTLQSVVYNTKKKLLQAGLPDVNYIEQRKGVFYWTKEIPLIEDAAEMDRLYQEALAEEDPARKQQLYLDACHVYQGEFLPARAGVHWASAEAKRYQDLFRECVEEAEKLLKESGDYEKIEELGRYAAKVQPLSDWENVTMKALVGMNKEADANRFYEDTVDHYFHEQRLQPSEQIMQHMDGLARQVEHGYAQLDSIQKELSAGIDVMPGGYQCAYPVFLGIYRMEERRAQREGRTGCLMLCSIVDAKGNPMKEGAVLKRLGVRLADSIRRSVRASDVFCRYGTGQYLLLLHNTTRESCAVIQRRIDLDFRRGRQRTGLSYQVGVIGWRAEAGR